MSHAFAANLGLGNFYAAAVAHGIFVFYAFVLTAVALPVAGRAEDAFAEEAALFGFKAAVVNGFGVFDLAVAP